MKEIFQNKQCGFHMTLGCIVLSLVTAVVYIALYSRSRYMSWTAAWVMLAGAVLACVLIAFKQYRFAPALLLVTNFVALLLFIYYIYFYISSVVTGIQFSGFPLEFYVNIFFFATTLVLSIVCVFMKQTQE